MKTQTKILVAIILILIASVLVISAYAFVNPDLKNTPFYLIGMVDKNGEFQRNSSVLIGFANRDYNLTNYTLKIVSENQTIDNIDIKLLYNTTWQKLIPVGNNTKLQFILSKEG